MMKPKKSSLLGISSVPVVPVLLLLLGTALLGLAHVPPVGAQTKDVALVATSRTGKTIRTSVLRSNGGGIPPVSPTTGAELESVLPVSTADQEQDELESVPPLKPTSARELQDDAAPYKSTSNKEHSLVEDQRNHQQQQEGRGLVLKGEKLRSHVQGENLLSIPYPFQEGRNGNGDDSGHVRVLQLTHPPTVSPTPSPTVSPTPSPTVSPTPSPTVSPTPSPTPFPTVSSTPLSTALPTPSPTPSPTVSPTPSPTPSPTVSPTPSPTVSPTPSPTASPTPSPTASPTPLPTPSPTVSSFSWKINGTEWEVGFGDDSGNSEIIGKYVMTPTRDYYFDVFEEDCSTSIDGGAVKVVNPTQVGKVPPNGEVQVKIDIDPVKISSSNVFKDSTRDNVKNIRICVKSSLKLNDVEINFHETIMSILVDMAQDFEIQNIVTDRTEAIKENKEVDSIATIKRFFCPNGTLTQPGTWNPAEGTPTPVFKQGSIFKVCLEVTTPNVSPKSILKFGFSQTDGGRKKPWGMLGPDEDKEELFAKGSVADSKCSQSKCMIQTMIPAEYFDDLNSTTNKPFDLEGSGSILLQFGPGNNPSARHSRLLQGTSTGIMTRSLQFEGSENSAQFEVPVSLEGGFNGNNIDAFEESAATTATVSHHGAVYAIILIGSIYSALM